MQIKLIRPIHFVIVLLFLMMTAGVGSADEVNVELVGSYDVFSPSYYLDSVAVSKENAYVIVNNPDITHPVIYSDLERVDISDLTKPTIKDYVYDIGFAANDVALSETHAYVADSKGLQIVPLTAFSSENKASYLTDDHSSISGIAVSGNYAYLNVGGSSLVILDVTTPSSPKYMGRYDTGGYGNVDAVNGIAVSSPYAYLAAPGIGLVVVNINSVSSPKLAGTYNVAGDARDVAVSEKYAYVISNRYASDDYVIDLDIIDITNPSSPKHVSSYFLSDIAGGYGYGYDIAVAGNYAYIADSYNGLVIVDISDPLSPTLAGSYNTESGAKDVAVSGNNVYLAADNNGLLILKTEIQDNGPTEGSLVQVQGSSDVYLIESGMKRHFTSPEALEWNGHSFSDVIQVSSESLASIRDGPDISIIQAIIDKYHALGGSPIFGQAVSKGELNGAPDSAGNYCSYVNFQNGAIEYFQKGPRAGKTYAIFNPFFTKWKELGYGSGILGYPIDDMSGQLTSKYGTTFRYQNFSNGDQRGALEYNINSGKVVEIHGAIFAKWAEKGFASGVLGLVTEDENTAATSPFKTVGKYSKFENGTIHWISSKTGENEGHAHRGQSFVTSGDLDAFYTSMGGTGGDLGFPIMDQITVGGHGYCRFEGGKIEWDDSTGAYRFTITPKAGEDNEPPLIQLWTPSADSSTIYSSPLLISGIVFDSSGVEKIFINSKDVTPPSGGTVFSEYIYLKEGENEITIAATDSSENHNYNVKIIYVNFSPLNIDTRLRPNPNGYQFSNFNVESLSWGLFLNTFGTDLVVDNYKDAVNFYENKYTKIAAGGSCFGISASSLVLSKHNLQCWGLAGPKISRNSLSNPGEGRSLDEDDEYVDINSNGQYDSNEKITMDYNQNGIYDSQPRNWGMFPSFISTPRDWVSFYTCKQLNPAVIKDSNEHIGPTIAYNSIKQRMMDGNWNQDSMILGISWYTEFWTDINMDGRFNRADGDTFIDRNLNGKLDSAGHAVIPYRIEEAADHQSAKVFVYDSNYPGDENRAVEFDFLNNIVTADGYGNLISDEGICAINLSAIEIIPDTIPLLESVSGSAHLLYTDRSGNQLGYLNDEFKREISGAYKVWIFSDQTNNGTTEEIYFISDLDLKKELYGTNDGIVKVLIPRPNSLVTLQTQVSPTSIDELHVPSNGLSVDFGSGNGTSFLNLMLQRGIGNITQIVRTNISQIEANGAVNLSNNNGTIIIQNHGLSRNCSLHLEQAVINPNSGDSSKNIVIEEDSTIVIKSVNWNDISSSNITVEHDVSSDGTVDYAEAVQLTDSTVSDSKSGGGGGGSSGGSSSSSKSSGGGGGGAGSAEDYANVALKDVDSQYLRMNTNITYEFTREGNPIQSVSFYSFKNSGEITSTIEVLNNRSKLVNSTPEGSIYKYVNIWVGKSGFATAANIKDAKVRFKVNSSWIKEMGVSPADVKLQRYNGTAWEVLPTTIESNATGYVIFEAQTPGFSPFVITAEKTLASSTGDNMDAKFTQEEDAGMNGTEPKKTPGFGFSMAILIIGVFAGGYVYLRGREK